MKNTVCSRIYLAVWLSYTERKQSSKTKKTWKRCLFLYGIRNEPHGLVLTFFYYRKNRKATLIFTCELSTMASTYYILYGEVAQGNDNTDVTFNGAI